jgi:tRNA G18 (ribose-2'-O)-methylase SpoU
MTWIGSISAPTSRASCSIGRPAPGNIGSIIRSADAFGAGGMIVTGHAADVYDSKCVRASTGSIFALPTVRVPSHREVMTGHDLA